jgi:hypothetical protein
MSAAVSLGEPAHLIVPKELWAKEEQTFCGSAQENEMVKLSQA